MKFIIDQQLPPAIGGWLRQHRHEAVHVRDIGLRDAPDAEIWKRAIVEGASILTKDEDFAARRKSVTVGPSIVWLRCGNVSTEYLIGLLAREWPAIGSELDRGASVIEVR
jgi:predicted nuclease of predicted toxin-antitoxin system